MSDIPDEPQGGPAGEPSQEIQRHLPELLVQLGEKALDGTVAGAASYGARKILDKVTGGPKPPADGGGQQGGPEAGPPPAEG